jgi:hypothetical protein
MQFNFQRFWRDIFFSLLQVPVTGKRLRFLVWFFLLFPVIVLSGWFGFLIDNIFYRRYMKQKIEKPLFIIGNFRSGSTLLQRLIALDEDQFAGMKSWEIYTAPSIAMRKAWRGLSTVDNWLGQPLKKALFGWEKRVLRTIRKHPVGVMEYEEDEGLFLFIWAGIIRWFFYPYKNHDENYHFFDTRVSEWRRRRFMKFYLRCIKRHVYYRGGRHYLSKNPTSTSKIRSILEWMPDARFVYLVRNPYDLLPSNFDFFNFVWNYFSDFPVQYPYSELLLEMTRHFYEYPLEVLGTLPENQYHIVRFNDLVKNPVGTVQDIYTRLDYPLTEEYRRRLVQEARTSHKHKGNRKITIRDIGVSPEYVRSIYKGILQRFHFREKSRPAG